MLRAGRAYNTPWTRDTSINVWNALGILSPEIAGNTLLSVCDILDGEEVIGVGYNQYWDCIVWAIGAYEYCKVSDDKEFMLRAYEIIKNTLKNCEKNEFDSEKNLFRGPAVYGDGVAAYPDKYGSIEGFSSAVIDWPEHNPDKKCLKGFGIPMFALSTNCAYYMAYKILGEIAKKTGNNPDEYILKAEKLKNAVNTHFWNEENGRYDYLAYECDYQEGLGLSLVILSGIADDDKALKTIENTYITEHGIACVWPSFERYLNKGDLGRHSGTVWPFIQGFWGRALLKCGKFSEFEENLMLMAKKAKRDGQFSEIYHSITGEIYGGLQENNCAENQENIEVDDIVMWKSARRQSWSATAYLSLIYYGILGLEYKGDTLVINPCLPTCCNELTVSGIPFFGKNFKINVKRGNEKTGKLVLDNNNYYSELTVVV